MCCFFLVFWKRNYKRGPRRCCPLCGRADMLVETMPGFPRGPRWLLNESLVTWKCFQYKVWHHPVEPRERIGPFTHSCRSRSLRSVLASGPSLSLHPFEGEHSPDSWLRTSPPSSSAQQKSLLARKSTLMTRVMPVLSV